MRKIQIKTSRGYRLKPSTHKMIRSLQEITQSDSDSVLTASCILYYKQILASDENVKSNISIKRKAS